MKKLEEYVMSIPDFPEPGVIFRDVTSILQDADGLKLAIDSLQALLKDVDFDVVVEQSPGDLFSACRLHTIYISPLCRCAKRESFPEKPWR